MDFKTGRETQDLKVYSYCSCRRLRIELIVAISYKYFVTMLAYGQKRIESRALHADLPAPDGPIINILRVTSDSSDAIFSCGQRSHLGMRTSMHRTKTRTPRQKNVIAKYR